LLIVLYLLPDVGASKNHRNFGKW